MAAFSCGGTLNYIGPCTPSRSSAATLKLLAHRFFHSHLVYFFRYYDSTAPRTPGGHKGKGRRGGGVAIAPLFSVPSPYVSATAANTPYNYAAQQEKEGAFTASSGWAEFAEHVSGEWDGFGADFTAEGKPVELPESVVPEAYRDWEVKVFDWQTQCPTLAQSLSFLYKTIQLLPTVGCEADAATRYSILERRIDHTHSSAARFAYQVSGCYVALWPIDDIGKCLELEHCLIDPRDRESRVRIIQVLKYQSHKDDDDSIGGSMNLESIKVFVEQWYGPFRDGDQLGGCAIRDSAFASTEPLDASRVVGTWQGPHAVAYGFQTSSIQQLGAGVHGNEECESIRREDDLVLLPRQLWCSFKRADNDEITYCEAGWLLEPGRAITSKCQFSSTAELQEIAIATETLNPDPQHSC